MADKRRHIPINQSVLIGGICFALVLSLLLAFQTRRSFSGALYDQYKTRLHNVVDAVEYCADADDLRGCIENAAPSPKYDELQRLLNHFVDDFELAYLYVILPQALPDGSARILSVVSSTSAAERAAGDTEDWPILYDYSDGFTRQELQPYLDAWNVDGISFFEGTSDYGLCLTGCKPLHASDGETVALICADYFVDDMQMTVWDYVLHDVLLIVGVCVLFGALLMLWLHQTVIKPIRTLERNALRFVEASRGNKDTSELLTDAEAVEASSEIGQLIDAVAGLSQEMKDQAESAAEVKSYAREMADEILRLTAEAEAAAKIANLTQSVTALLTNMPGLTFSKDVKTGRYLACNQAFAAFANRQNIDGVVGLTDAEIFDETTASHFVEDDRKAMAMDEPYVFFEDVLDAAGKSRQFQTTKLKFTDTTGRLCLLGMCQDVTELTRVRKETVEAKAAYEQARNASAMYANIIRALSASYSRLYYVDLETGDFIEYRSDAGDLAEERQGKHFFEASAVDAAEQIYPADLEMFLDAFTKEKVLREVDERGAFTLSYRLVAGGKPVLMSMKATRLPDDERHLFIGVNISDELDARSELTGLHLESALYTQGKELLSAHPEGWCVIAIDLEHFKLFNEWYGREAGDRLLAQIGERLIRVEELIDGLACYLGQDDFALLAPYDEDNIKRLFGEIHEFVVQHGTSVGFMPAFGVCLADGSDSVEELLDRAAQAAQHAKDNFHRRIRLFEESMYEKTERDYQILSDFQLALKNHELFIQLQPQCEIANGRIVGAESLVRWRKSDGTMVSPGVFVPVLERYGFVTDLDQFVWEEVCVWQRRWIDGGHTPLPVSVNVSQIDIFTLDVPAYFAQLLAKYRLPVDIIKIEITESAYVGDAAVADTVRRLRNEGFLVLMDDFGSGYSSLNMLRSLNVDIIKLDAQFLRMNGEDRKGVHILESIVGMAKSLEAPIIVEGVETQEETEFITSLGCRYVQGYYFYRPMPVKDFEALIGDEKNIDASGFSL